MIETSPGEPASQCKAFTSRSGMKRFLPSSSQSYVTFLEALRTEATTASGGNCSLTVSPSIKVNFSFIIFEHCFSEVRGGSGRGKGGFHRGVQWIELRKLSIGSVGSGVCLGLGAIRTLLAVGSKSPKLGLSLHRKGDFPGSSQDIRPICRKRCAAILQEGSSASDCKLSNGRKNVQLIFVPHGLAHRRDRKSSRTSSLIPHKNGQVVSKGRNPHGGTQT
ncbi:uncharacterized protein LOC144615906 [Panthera onca]